MEQREKGEEDCPAYLLACSFLSFFAVQLGRLSIVLALRSDE